MHDKLIAAIALLLTLGVASACKEGAPPSATVKDAGGGSEDCGPEPSDGCSLAWRACRARAESGKSFDCAKNATIEAFPGAKAVNENIELVQSAIELVEIFKDQDLIEVLKYFGGEDNANVSAQAAEKLNNVANNVADKAEDKGKDVAKESVKKLGYAKVECPEDAKAAYDAIAKLLDAVRDESTPLIGKMPSILNSVIGLPETVDKAVRCVSPAAADRVAKTLKRVFQPVITIATRYSKKFGITDFTPVGTIIDCVGSIASGATELAENLGCLFRDFAILREQEAKLAERRATLAATPLPEKRQVDGRTVGRCLEQRLGDNTVFMTRLGLWVAAKELDAADCAAVCGDGKTQRSECKDFLKEFKATNAEVGEECDEVCTVGQTEGGVGPCIAQCCRQKSDCVTEAGKGAGLGKKVAIQQAKNAGRDRAVEAGRRCAGDANVASCCSGIIPVESAKKLSYGYDELHLCEDVANGYPEVSAEFTTDTVASECKAVSAKVACGPCCAMGLNFIQIIDKNDPYETNRDYLTCVSACSGTGGASPEAPAPDPGATQRRDGENEP